MFVCGVDIGYSSLKCASGTLAGQLSTSISPAGAAPIAQVGRTLQGALPPGVICVDVDGVEYAACVDPAVLANWPRALHEDYPSTPIYQALFKAALAKAGVDEVDLLVTGLPVSQFKDDHRRRRREQLMAQLQGRHRVRQDREVFVREVAVVPQPVGSYLDAAVSAGRENEMKDADVIVIDPGYFSFDWVWISGGSFQRDWSGSSTLAVSRILEGAVRDLCERYGKRISVERLESAIRNKQSTIAVYAQKVALEQILADAAREVAAGALENVKTAVRSKGSDADFVVLAGGGARYFEPVVREVFPHAAVIIPAAPVESNARGYWFYGIQ